MTPEHRELQEKVIVWLKSRITQRGICAATEVALGKYIVDVVALGSLQWRFWEAIQRNSPQPQDLIMAFEVKVSRSDYRKLPICKTGNLQWVVTTKGLITSGDVLAGWGWLQREHCGLREIIKPAYTPTTQQQVNECAYALLWAQKHSERRERIRDFKKSIKEMALPYIVKD